MAKTNEEIFASLLSNHGFELLKSEQGTYFVFDLWNIENVPKWSELAMSEDFGMGLKAACNDLSVEQNDNGTYHIAYHGDNEEYATLFESTLEERTGVLAPLAEKCDLDVDELLNVITVSDIEELVDLINQSFPLFHGNDEVLERYIEVIYRDCEGSPYLKSCPLQEFQDVLKLEEQLLANKDDPEAQKMLDIIGDKFDNYRLLLTGDYYTLSLDKVYDAQEAGKGGKEAKKAKDIIERD